MKFFLKIGRFVICLLLIYFIITQVDWQPLKNIFKNIRIGPCLFLLGLLVIQYLIKALKWHILLLAKNIQITVLKIFQVDYTSTFLSLFVPSSISLDLFRGYGLSREATSKKEAASSIIADRLLSLLALTVTANFSVLMFHKRIAVPGIAYAVFSILVVFVTLILIANAKTLPQFIYRSRDYLRRFKPWRKLEDLVRSIHEYRLHKSALLKVFLLSLVMQFCRILVYYTASLAVNADIDFKHFMIFTPVIMFIVMLPISLAGLGLREGSFVFFFGKVGVDSAVAFAISSIVSVLVVISLLPGGLILALKGLALKKESVYLEESALIDDTKVSKKFS